jgi:hypothetical protein
VRPKNLSYDFQWSTRQWLCGDKQTIADQAGAVSKWLTLVAKSVDYIRNGAPDIRLSLPVVSHND